MGNLTPTMKTGISVTHVVKDSITESVLPPDWRWTGTRQACRVGGWRFDNLAGQVFQFFLLPYMPRARQYR